MDDSSPEISELETLKSALCFKDHEIFSLHTELNRVSQGNHLLVQSIERLEKTTSACFDRLVRKVDRLVYPGEAESRKRRRHY